MAMKIDKQYQFTLELIIIDFILYKLDRGQLGTGIFGVYMPR